SMASKTKDIPILVTAVTDPADSGLVESNEVPGGNVTGTSDLTPVKEQMQLLTQLCPDAKKVAMLYCTSEANSKFQIDLAKEEAAKYGIEAIEKTVSDANDVQSVVQSLVGKVDAIYVPTDNVIASNMTLVAQIATSNNIPLFVGENNSVENGGLATYSVDYYELGKLTAKQAVRILENGETPANMPIEYLSENKLYINMDLAKQLGIEIPADLAEKAIDVKA
ncbi:MAG: ABC transporter substrate-binding protein, partial [Acutalibacteraceae bacterium]|nr:ABC transporter substrate-binding protein [Acutalibacteraceae bacterium]